ncbi:Plus3 domain-containing protein, partial [Haematococcus lacustris]
FTWDAASIRAKVEARRQAGAAPVNIAAEKQRLEGLLRDLDARAIAAKPGDARNFGLSHVNKRNQQGNVTSGAGDSQKGQSDPFSRRTTRPTIYWNTTGSRGGQAGGQASQATDADPNGQAASQEVRELEGWT